jgi:hypothetical protein
MSVSFYGRSLGPPHPASPVPAVASGSLELSLSSVAPLAASTLFIGHQAARLREARASDEREAYAFLGVEEAFAHAECLRRNSAQAAHVVGSGESSNPRA